jgi:hypothetical protein
VLLPVCAAIVALDEIVSHLRDIEQFINWVLSLFGHGPQVAPAAITVVVEAVLHILVR